jgi:hypothetical protein
LLYHKTNIFDNRSGQHKDLEGRISYSNLRVGSHGVPSPTHISKFQHGDKIPTFEPQEILEILFIYINVEFWLFYVN